MYFQNSQLLENTLLPYFDTDESLKPLNKLFSKLNYEKYQSYGILETYYIKTRTIKERKIYKNEKFDVLYQEWYQNGKLMARYSYKNGYLNGLYKIWYKNGKLASKYRYKNGYLKNFQDWSENGKLWKKCWYTDIAMKIFILILRTFVGIPA